MDLTTPYIARRDVPRTQSRRAMSFKAVKDRDLDLPGVKFYRREAPGGTTAYYVRFHRRGRKPKWIRMESRRLQRAYGEALLLAGRYERGTFDPWLDPVRPVSLEQAAKEWLDSGRRDWAADTLRGRRGIMNLFVRDHRRVDVRDVEPRHIEDFIDRPGLAAESRKSYFNALRTFFAVCEKKRYIEKSPLAAMKAPRGKGRTGGAYFRDMEELDHFCEVAERYYRAHRRAVDPGGRGNFIWIVDMVRFAVSTGLRKGEIRRLVWDHVDLEKGRLSVGKSKTPTSRRTVPITPAARRVLERRFDCLADAAASGRLARLTGSTPVFLGPKLEKVPGASQINKVFCQVRDMAGFPESLVFHSCRHTYATWLVRAGAELYEVKELMGHARISTTYDTYSHHRPKKSKIADEVFS